MSARVLDAKDIDISKVSILSKVKVINLGTKKEKTYKIVSEKEADVKLDKISVNSLLGQALLGKKIGDVAEYTAPSGTFKFKIESIGI